MPPHEPKPGETMYVEYYELWQLADAMDRMFRDVGVDFTGHRSFKPCHDTCPLCVARRRFDPKRQPRLVENQDSSTSGV